MKPNIAIVIPTYKRIEKLDRCIESIFKSTWEVLNVFVYADNQDTQTKDFLALKYPFDVFCKVNLEHKYVIGGWNDFTKTLFNADWQIMMWCVDDVELYPDCLEKAVQAMHEHFPDYDGVVGISQECPGHEEYTYKPYGQVLLGKKFIERYKEANYAVCCPAYTHFFQDEEMWQYATSINKFYHCKEALLKHYHPAFIKSEMDATHPIVRGAVFQRDRQIFAQRQSQNLIWGKTWQMTQN